MFYFSYQEKPMGPWTVALSDDKEQIVTSSKPAFYTVLECDSSNTKELTREEMWSVKYRGPFYVDFDCDDEEGGLAYAIDQFKLFLGKMRDYRLNLDTVALFATGGRGFHVEIPAASFIKKEPVTGLNSLPHVYREMARNLEVDTMDLAIYGSQRMWRTPNVERSNGMYKVQITYDEALRMDVDLYEELCSKPRSLFQTVPATYCSGLALLYATSRDKVDLQQKRIRAGKKKTEELRQFKGAWPTTVKAVLDGGVSLRQGAGWNKIAMQIALTALELGKSEAELLEASEGLVRAHKGDGSRYATAVAKRRELRNQYRFMQDNPCYEFSMGGLLSIFDLETDVSELRVRAETNLSSDEVLELDENSTSETLEDGGSFTSHILTSKKGIYVANDEGKFKRVSQIGLLNPDILVDTATGLNVGYEFDVWGPKFNKDEKKWTVGKFGRQFLPLSSFSTRNALHQSVVSYGLSAANLTDQQAMTLVDHFSRQAHERGGVVYRIGREGLDLIQPPGVYDKSKWDIVWSSPTEVVSQQGLPYKFHGVASPGGTFHSDLFEMPMMEGTGENLKFVRDFLTINKPKVVARCVGWFSAAMLCQIIRSITREFPILQVCGESESGKSKTVTLFNHLFYGHRTPVKLAASAVTQHILSEKLSQSASIPVVFDEVKFREMTKQQRDMLNNAFRNSYDATENQRGTISRERGHSEVTVKKYTYVAPMVFMGEAMEDQKAILDRCLVVQMSPEGRSGRSLQFRRVMADVEKLGTLGRVMLHNAMGVSYETVKKTLLDSHIEACERMEAAGYNLDTCERMTSNLGVAILGLKFFSQTIRGLFGNKLDTLLSELDDALADEMVNAATLNISEVARVLDVLAQLTRGGPEELRMRRGEHYTVADGFVDIRIKPAFARYTRYVLALGYTPLFDSDRKFQGVAANHSATVSSNVTDNYVLFRNVNDPVFRFSIEKLMAEQVEPFEE